MFTYSSVLAHPSVDVWPKPRNLFICTQILSWHLKDTYQLTLLLNVFLGCSILLGDLLDLTFVRSGETARSFSLSFAFSCWPHNNSLKAFLKIMHLLPLYKIYTVQNVELHKFDNSPVSSHVLSWQIVRKIWLSNGNRCPTVVDRYGCSHNTTGKTT